MPPAKDGGDNGQLEYKVYDAVLTSDGSSPVDPEMAKFLPLLEEYLTRTYHPHRGDNDSPRYNPMGSPRHEAPPFARRGIHWISYALRLPYIGSHPDPYASPNPPE
jgi:hypothetical protein